MAISTTTRFFQKNGKEANWNKVVDFIPGKGEIIIYNPDETHDAPRMKIGNGVDLPKDLPFIEFDGENYVAKRVEHSLYFGADKVYQFDGSKDVTVPVYMGEYNN